MEEKHWILLSELFCSGLDFSLVIVHLDLIIMKSYRYTVDENHSQRNRVASENLLVDQGHPVRMIYLSCKS